MVSDAITPLTVHKLIFQQTKSMKSQCLYYNAILNSLWWSDWSVAKNTFISLRDRISFGLG